MSYSARSLWTRVKIGGNWVKTGPVRVSESLDQLSRVAEFDLSEQAADEPAEGDGVLIEWFDFTAGNFYPLFGGTIDGVEIESQPWAFTVRCNDQLRKLDITRQTSDYSMSGKTPKQVMEDVLTYCGVTYDAADLADPAYTLGAFDIPYWHIDTPGSVIANELSTVFGCALETVGNDRVIWLSLDETPDDATGLYRTYTRGTSIDFAGHRRTHGDRSRIQNNWVVRGATVELSSSCTGQVWAKAVGTNPQLGRRRRIQQQEFQSDLIQTEDLAEAIVRRLMRRTNKLPDEATSPIVDDPNIHPGSKIAVVDPTYGIEANPRYFMVTQVDRQGSSMTLALTAGPGGSEGTVTTGVDKVCTDTHSDIDWPGSGFDFPAFDFPPIDLGVPIDFGADPDIPSGFGGDASDHWRQVGGDGGGGGLSCATPLEEDWTLDAGNISDFVLADGFVQNPNAGQVHNTVISVTDADAWQLRATMFASANNTVEIGLTTNGVDAPYYCIVYASGEAGPARLEVSSPDDNAVDTTDLSGAPVDVVVTRDVGAQTVTATFGTLVGLVVPDTTPDPGPLFPYVRIYDLGGAGNGQVSNMELCVGGEGLVLDANWTAIVGSWTFPGDTEAHNSDATGADAYASGMSFDGTGRVRFSGHGNVNGTDSALFSLILNDTELMSPTGDFAGIQFITGGTPSFYVYTWDGFQTDLGIDLEALASGFDFLIDWNPMTKLMVFLFRDSSDNSTVASGAYALGTQGSPMTVHINQGGDTTIVCDFTDLLIRVGT